MELSPPNELLSQPFVTHDLEVEAEEEHEDAGGEN